MWLIALEIILMRHVLHLLSVQKISVEKLWWRIIFQRNCRQGGGRSLDQRSLNSPKSPIQVASHKPLCVSYWDLFHKFQLFYVSIHQPSYALLHTQSWWHGGFDRVGKWDVILSQLWIALTLAFLKLTATKLHQTVVAVVCNDSYWIVQC